MAPLRTKQRRRNSLRDWEDGLARFQNCMLDKAPAAGQSEIGQSGGTFIIQKEIDAVRIESAKNQDHLKRQVDVDREAQKSKLMHRLKARTALRSSKGSRPASTASSGSSSSPSSSDPVFTVGQRPGQDALKQLAAAQRAVVRHKGRSNSGHAKSSALQSMSIIPSVSSLQPSSALAQSSSKPQTSSFSIPLQGSHLPSRASSGAIGATPNLNEAELARRAASRVATHALALSKLMAKRQREVDSNASKLPKGKIFLVSRASTARQHSRRTGETGNDLTADDISG